MVTGQPTPPYGSGENRLSVYDVATKQSQETPASGEVTAPSWSPDGKKIAFYAMTSDKPEVDLQVMKTDTGQVQTLASVLWKSARKAKSKPGKSEDEQEPGFATFFVTGAISWSPDEPGLVCTNAAPTATGALLVNLALGEAKPILQGRHTIFDPVLVPGSPQDRLSTDGEYARRHRGGMER